jgi:hypothetical protein
MATMTPEEREAAFAALRARIEGTPVSGEPEQE